jgi:hypothetical protein
MDNTKQALSAQLELTFPPDWNRIILGGTRAAYKAEPSHVGRKSIVGYVPIDDSLFTNPSQISIQRGVLQTFELVRHVATPVHTVDGFGSIADERATAPDHDTFIFEVLQDLPQHPADDFDIVSYRAWLKKEEAQVRFSIEVMWKSKSIAQPRETDIAELFRQPSTWL